MTDSSSRSPVVAYLSIGDSLDESSWSGMLYASRSALEGVVDVIPIRVDVSRHSLIDRGLARGLGSAGRPYLPAHAIGTAHKWGLAASRAVRDTEADVVLAVAASSLTAFATFDVPVISVSDATFQLTAAMYPDYAGMPRWVMKQAKWLERRAWQRSDLCVVTSKWAVDSLVRDYGVAASKCRVLPFGPGVTPGQERSRDAAERRLRILLVTGDWMRKRGDRALAMHALLREMGIDTKLTVVGAPESVVREELGVEWLPRRSRADMADLYRTTDVVLDLADANCASVTLVDAAAWGLPVVATDVGAASEIVVHGTSGLLVPSDEGTPSAAAHAIIDIARSDSFLAPNSVADRRSSSRFTWQTWAQGIRSGIAEVTSL